MTDGNQADGQRLRDATDRMSKAYSANAPAKKPWLGEVADGIPGIEGKLRIQRGYQETQKQRDEEEK